MKLTTSLKLSAGFILIVGIAVGASVFWQANAEQKTLLAIDEQKKLTDLSQQVSQQSLSLTDNARRYTIAGDTVFKDNYFRLVNVTQGSAKALAQLKLLGVPAEDLALAEESKKLSDTLIKTEEEAFAAVEAKDFAKAQSLVFGAAYDAESAKIMAPVKELQQRIADRAAQQVVATKGTASLALIVTDVLLVLWALTVLAVILFLYRKLAKLPTLAAVADRIAAGDLRVEALATQGDDEIAQLCAAFDQMVSNLRSLAQDLTGSAKLVLSTSQELSSSSEQAAAASQGTAQAIGQVAGSASEQSQAAANVKRVMDEFQMTIAQIATGASQSSSEVQTAATLVDQMVRSLSTMVHDVESVAEAAGQAAQTAQSGAKVVQQTADGMERIREAAGATGARIKELETLSAQIGEITTVISGIADQTNLLALNAAIEAARAGEHGRGFAVVAEEVRKLAERSSASTKQIAGLISSIQGETAEAVRAMELATNEVEGGNRQAAEAAHALQEIKVTVEEAAVQVRSVASTAVRLQADAQNVVKAFDSMAAVTEESTAATEEMAASAEQINHSISAITDLAQGNAASAEEVSASVEELTASADQVAASSQNLAKVSHELESRVAEFKL